MSVSNVSILILNDLPLSLGMSITPYPDYFNFLARPLISFTNLVFLTALGLLAPLIDEVTRPSPSQRNSDTILNKVSAESQFYLLMNFFIVSLLSVHFNPLSGYYSLIIFHN